MKRILVFQHVKHETIGRFEDILENRGIEYDVLEFWKKYENPELENYDALLVMGGPQSVYEGFPSRDFEIGAIRKFTEENKPVLGLCLGSQLIAKAFDADVHKNIINGKPSKETGFFDISLTKEALNDAIFKGFPRTFKVFQWHGDIFEMPENAVLLATGEYVINQAFRIKNSRTYATLFHFEFTPSMIEELIKVDKEWLHKDNRADEKIITEQAHKYEKQLNESSRNLFENWLDMQG